MSRALVLASFLFDWVPAQAQPQAAEEAARPEPAAQSPEAEAPAALPAYYVHAPYAAGDCERCHAAQAPGRLLKQGMDLCLGCHARPEVEAVHGELGDCLVCHDPHKAQVAFLLDFEWARK